MNNKKKVEAFVAVEITQGAHLVEESVKDGLYGFRNIVCWKNGDARKINLRIFLTSLIRRL